MIESTDFADHFLGYTIRDCVVQDRSNFYFIADSDDDRNGCEPAENPDKRCIKIELQGSENPVIKHVSVTGFNTSVCCEIIYPENRIAFADGEGLLYIAGSGIENPIEPVHSGGLLGGAVTRIKPLADQLLLSTNGRDLLARKGKESWERVGPKLESNWRELEGFNDFDSFAIDDIYAVGGESDVYHFNGENWTKLNFPSRHGPCAVCCAADGSVYIADCAGSIYRGRNESWTQIHSQRMPTTFYDLVWFEDKVWCTHDYGVQTIEDGQLQEFGVASPAMVFSGHLSARDETLLAAGSTGAIYRQNGEWREIFVAQHLRDQAS